jgi:hypothetical protein
VLAAALSTLLAASCNRGSQNQPCSDARSVCDFVEASCGTPLHRCDEYVQACPAYLAESAQRHPDASQVETRSYFETDVQLLERDGQRVLGKVAAAPLFACDTQASCPPAAIATVASGIETVPTKLHELAFPGTKTKMKCSCTRSYPAVAQAARSASVTQSLCWTQVRNDEGKLERRCSSVNGWAGCDPDNELAYGAQKEAKGCCYNKEPTVLSTLSDAEVTKQCTLARSPSSDRACKGGVLKAFECSGDILCAREPSAACAALCETRLCEDRSRRAGDSCRLREKQAAQPAAKRRRGA